MEMHVSFSLSAWIFCPEPESSHLWEFGYHSLLLILVGSLLSETSRMLEIFVQVSSVTNYIFTSSFYYFLKFPNYAVTWHTCSPWKKEFRTHYSPTWCLDMLQILSWRNVRSGLCKEDFPTSFSGGWEAPQRGVANLQQGLGSVMISRDEGTRTGLWMTGLDKLLSLQACLASCLFWFLHNFTHLTKSSIDNPLV